MTQGDSKATELLLEKHVEYVVNHGNDKNDFVSRLVQLFQLILIDLILKEYTMTEFLRMSGIYWGATCLDIMGHLDKLDKQSIIDFIKQCQCPESGGISACDGHDPHLLYTLSAVQILCIYDALSEIDVAAVGRYVTHLQQLDGSFFGDKWGEVDTRFSFCAVAILALTNQMHLIDVEKAADFVLSCANPDGGFGSKPHAESHAGLIYCCVGFLSITHNLHRLEREKLAWWLCERQLKSGGLNGRPEKLPDVCYSWWVLASLTILGRSHWISSDKLKEFIVMCQDTETGGFSDRPGNFPDVFHTLFGVGALSLLGYPNLKKINPTFCMPEDVVGKIFKVQILDS